MRKWARRLALVILVAVVAATIAVAVKGLPPTEDVFVAAGKDDVEQVRRSLRWGVGPDTTTPHPDSWLDVPSAPDAGPSWWQSYADGLSHVWLHLRWGIDLDVRKADGSSLLTCATWSHSRSVIRFLLAEGADPSAPDGNGTPALHAALPATALARDTAVILLEHGADIEGRNYYGATPLCAAVAHADVETVRFLIGAGADVNGMNCPGWTPLHVVVDTEQPRVQMEMVRLLVEAGANLRLKNCEGITPLQMAIHRNHLEAAQFLISAGARPEHGEDEFLALSEALGRDGTVMLELVLGIEGLDTSARGNDSWPTLGRTPLHEALRWNRVDKVRLLLDHGADVNACDATGSTPLRESAVSNCEDLTLLLIERGADLAAANHALTSAAHNGQCLLAQVLLDKGLDVNAVDEACQTPLLAAIWGEHPEVAQLLISRGADPHMGRPLMGAAWCGQPSVADALLARGADPNVRDEQGCTLLHAAAGGGLVDLMRQEIARGADLEAPSHYDSWIWRASADGWTPLFYAADRGRPETVAFLLDAGANLRAVDSTGRTALHYASTPEVADLLISRGLRPNDRADDGSAPLHDAIRDAPRGVYGYKDVVPLLLARGADVNACDNRGYTPLIMAICDGDRGEDMALALIRRGADVHAFCDDGLAPIHFAAWTGQDRVLVTLLNRGIDPETRTWDGRTPIFQASTRSSTEIARLLVAHGASVNVRDQDGRTPLHTAANCKSKNMIEFLKARGADPTARDNDGQSPEEYAAAEALKDEAEEKARQAEGE